MDEQTKLAGRVQALEWFLATILADAMASSPDVQAAAIRFKKVCDTKAGDLARQGAAAGDPAGFPTLAFANALLDLKANALQMVAAHFAETSGKGN